MLLAIRLAAYAATGLVLGSAGVFVSTHWQFWGVMICVAIIDLTRALDN